MPYEAYVYTNNHVLNSALSNICYHLAGSHRFVLRIPNVLSFIILCYGVFKYFKYLNKLSSKIILVCFFILTLNFLDFFELCRGYGLSMAFMVAGLAYLQDYFTDKKFSSLLVFSVCLQLALAANLIFVVVLTVLLLFVFLFQFKHKLFFEWKNLLVQMLNVAFLYFWIKFSFFYKENGMLDSGVGDSYWSVSFKSLMDMIFGTDDVWIQILIPVIFGLMLFASIVGFFKSFSLINIFEPRFFYLIVFTSFVFIFYLQKKMLGINYPEDRTGLFFYVFFALSIGFFFDGVGERLSSLFAGSLLAASVVYFCATVDLKSFNYYFYHVVPKEIYSYLETEHNKNNQLFTIGGHPNREMNYTFMNYRAGSLLNPMDDPRQMHMNCDYAFALACEKPFYQNFYEEVAYDHRWQRVLLKRKQAINRIDQIHLAAESKSFTGSQEFFDFLSFKDTALKTRNCIEADIALTFNTLPKPFKAFVVMQVVTQDGENLYYKKVPLYWIADNLNGQTKRFKLTSGPLPVTFNEVKLYLWNTDKNDCDFKLNRLRIYELNAPGINVVVPENYYPYAKQFVNEELL